jgi:hypothetical protein
MKVLILILCALSLVGSVMAGTSGVTNGVSKMTPMGLGQGFLKQQVEFNDDVVTALDTHATELALGLTKNGTSTATDLSVRYGTCTNGQTVTWGTKFTTAVVLALIEPNALAHSTTNPVFTSITTSNGIASQVTTPFTNRWIVIGR